MRFNSPTAAIRRQLAAGNRYSQVMRIPIGIGDASVARTIAAMRAMIEHAADHPDIHQIASTIAAEAPNRNRRAQLEALDNFLIETLHFKPDTAEREVLRHPAQLAGEIRVNGRAACDCDDVAMFGASIIRALGMRPALRVVSLDGGEFSHVHFAALVPRPTPRLVPLDPQERIPVGKWTPARRHRVWWA